MKDRKQYTRREQIAIRLNEYEKDLIKSCADQQDQNMAEFIRTCIFSHITNSGKYSDLKVYFDPLTIKKKLIDIEDQIKELKGYLDQKSS